MDIVSYPREPSPVMESPSPPLEDACKDDEPDPSNSEAAESGGDPEEPAASGAEPAGRAVVSQTSHENKEQPKKVRFIMYSVWAPKMRYTQSSSCVSYLLLKRCPEDSGVFEGNRGRT